MAKIFQHGTLELIMAGLYDGTLTFEELLKHGHTGIGTTHSLDGEVTMLDGHVYQTTSDGSTTEITDLSTKTPFASAHGDADVFYREKQSLDFNHLNNLVVKHNTDNLINSVRAHGTFKNILVRVAPAQNKPYPSFDVVAENQPTFEYHDVTGTIIGDYGNAVYTGMMAEGWHIHFISDDRTIGGHILSFSGDDISTQLGAFSEINLHLPAENSDFMYHKLNAQGLQDAISKAEG